MKLEVEDIVLIKINRSYKDSMSPEELYHATSFSWVASFKKTETRDLKYYCAVYQNKIIEVYHFLGYEEEQPKREPSRYILQGEIASQDIRDKLIGLDVGDLHKGSGNPIKYTTLNRLLHLQETGGQIDSNSVEVARSVHSSELIHHIHTYLQSKGFRYSLENIKNLYLSLRSKPFVIISGISGTGKTKIVQLFAESLGATEGNGQFKLIPVRPDWSDSLELLGYVDLKGDFKKGPLTEMIEQAHEHPQLPHFVLLDEMNLARVEYYFSDVLSVMESRKREGENITSSLLVSYQEDGQERKIYLPNNLYIIGTVNMDETTHPFSKKVLDRANTIEFNEIHLEDFSFLKDLETKEPICISNDQLVASYLNIKDVYQEHEALVQRVSNDLSKINQHLQHIKAEVGYRVRDEICFYMAWNGQDTEPLLDEDLAFDFCTMQKVLPRILGSGKHVEDTLQGLFQHFTGTSYELGMNVQNISTKYPKSVKKIADMLEGFYDVGFTSFWNA